MSYATIMVHLLAGQSNDAVLTTAAELARLCDARLVGIAATQPEPVTYGGMDNGVAIVMCRDEMDTQTQGAEAEFRAAFATAAQPVEWRSTYTCAALSDYISAESRCADLIVTCHQSPTYSDPARHVDVGDLIMRSGRPVIVVPHTMTRVGFDRVVIAWHDSREARRAVCDAIPLMRAASQVIVVEIVEAGDLATAQARVEDVAAWLAGHGINADGLASPSVGDDAKSLEAILDQQHADLVVAGAYGHSRMREWAFGGITRTILHGDRCALLSH